ncbi:gp16 family protein [Thermodesulfobacteriota bacterium]
MPTRSELAKIHIAKKELGLSDEEYRDILQHRFKKRSAKDLTHTQVQVLLGVFKLAGWKPKFRSVRGRNVPQATDPQSRKIRALWIRLHNIGEVRDPSELALNKFVKRMTKVDFLQWTTPAQKSMVIEALKLWVDRRVRKQESNVSG